jgi:hypothetical protein
MDPIHAPTIDPFQCRRPSLEIPPPLPKTFQVLQEPPTWELRTWGDLSNRIKFTFGP